MKEQRENIVAIKSFEFAVKIVNLCKLLADDQREYVLSKQLLRSGTSIGANIEEAIGGISKKDFRAKMSISYKEARETHYWLRLMHKTGLIPENDFKELEKDCIQLMKILFSIVKSSEV